MTERLLCWSRKPVALSLKGSNPFRCVIEQTLDFEGYLREKELAETTIQYKLTQIKYLEKRFNLWDFEGIRKHIREHTCGARRKNNLSYAYKDWCRWKGYDYNFKFFKETSIDLLVLSKFTPLPGSEFYKVANQYGTLINNWRLMSTKIQSLYPKI